MTIQNIILSCILLVMGTSTIAQSLKEIKKNKDIIWAAEQETNYLFIDIDITSSAAAYITEKRLKRELELTNNQVKILKSVVAESQKSYPADNSELLHRKLHAELYNKDGIKLYKTNKLETTYTSRELKDILYDTDTIITFDPTNYDEIVKLVENIKNPNDLRTFKIKEIIYYDNSKMEFRIVPQAIGINEFLYNGNGKSTGKIKTVIWLPINVVNKALDYSNQKELSWARRTYQNRVFSEISNQKIIKGNQSQKEITTLMLNDISKKYKKVHLGDPKNRDGATPLTDPSIVKQKIDAGEWNTEQLSGVQFIQDWYWNNTTKQLSVRYVGFAPFDQQQENQYNTWFIRR
ncbi:MAG: hypothetical protein MK212_06270 [Saprospiraceae bacterium]|nr:hypothetical protein [Saprospiraceae bacterium]